ncbi:MAG: hypothetical protein ACLU6W_04915 [Lachnospiraceae bacterium]
MFDIKKVADDADLIINGYAFTKCEMGYRILNLNHPNRAAVVSKAGEILETTMDDIELSIIEEYFEKNKELIKE